MMRATYHGNGGLRAYRPVGLPSLVVRCSKGFASGDKSAKSTDDDKSPSNTKVKRVKTKGKQMLRMGAAPVQPPPQQKMVAAPSAIQESNESLVEQIEFEQRLSSLKAQAAAKRVEDKAAGILPIDPMNIDPLAPPPSPYDNPPSLKKTLFGGEKEDANSKDYEGIRAGPSQVALGALSLALIGIFLVANSGSDLGYAAKRRTTAAPQGIENMSQDTKDELNAQLKTFDTQLEANAEDTSAIEGAAVIHARLGEYKQAAELLDKLTTKQSNNVDAWRVLAESRSALGESSKALVAYKTAWSASGESNLEVLQGLIGEQIASGDAKQAVDLLTRLASSPESASKIGEVELGLLLAKTLAQWGGHLSDALAQYDKIAEAHPDDFRAPLGKGLLLQQEGQTGDAQRFFLQARYLAPKSSRPVVEALIKAAQSS